MTAPSRRQLITAAAALGASLAIGERRSLAAGSEVQFDFTQPFKGWETVTGKWGIEDVPGASQGKALVQRATNNSFNVIVAPGGPYTDVDVSVRFKPISGSEDASAGIVFRFLRRPLLRDPSQCFGGQLQFLLLRSGPPSDHRRARQGSGAWPVAQIAHHGRGGSHQGLAE